MEKYNKFKVMFNINVLILISSMFKSNIGLDSLEKTII